jgi:predicted NAD/FAD-binding protein
MLDFPAESFIQFCLNHGLLQISDRPQWLTIKGSSRQYVKQLCAGIGDVRLNTPVIAVSSHEHGVHIQTEHEHLSFDKVILEAKKEEAAILQRAREEAKAISQSAMSELSQQSEIVRNQVLLETDRISQSIVEKLLVKS